jgi:hypothetical protein
LFAAAPLQRTGGPYWAVKAHRRNEGCFLFPLGTIDAAGLNDDNIVIEIEIKRKINFAK